MPIRFSPQRALLLAATLATALAACPAAAQQSTPTPPPPTPNQPTSDAATKLRGINPPPFPMAADKLPVPQLKLPKGFKIEVFMSGVPNARSLRLGDKGTVFISNRILDKVYAVVEKDGKRELKVIASGLDRPNGLAFHDGTLYIAEGTKVSKLEKIEDNLDNRRSPSSSTISSPTTSRTVGNSSRWDPTISSTSTSGRPVTFACRPRPTLRSGA